MRDRSDRALEQLFELDGEPGPARPIDERHAAGIVAAALGGAGFGPVGGGGGAAAAKGAGGAKLALVAAGGVLVIAAIGAVAFFASRGGAPERAPSEPPAIAAAPPSVDAAAAPTVAAPTEPAPAASDDDELEMPEDPARPHPRASAKEVEDLLAQANHQRAAHAWSRADALYARVVRASPKSLAAQTALVASGSLHLEHLADAAGAQKRFRAALAQSPHGALAEDARWGLAESARARNDTAAERRALDDFLAHHASSPLAARARARRATLDAPP